MVVFQKSICNILNVSSAENVLRKQHIMTLLCSIKSHIVKIETCTLGCLENTNVNILLIMKRFRPIEIVISIYHILYLSLVVVV